MLKKVEDTTEEQGTNGEKVASSEVMNKTLKLVSNEFNLDDSYTMIAFKDGANNCNVTLANSFFEVSVKVRSKIEVGIEEPQE